MSALPPSDMSMRGRTPADHLDELIDEAARSMTDAQPSARLRTGIRSRVERRRERLSLVQWRPAAAIAAVFILVGAAALVRFLPSAPDGQRVAEIGRGDVELPAAVAPSPAGRSPIETGNGQRGLPAPLPRRARASNAIATAFQIAPGDEPTPPPFPALFVDRLAIDPLPADPVTLEDMTGPVPLQVQRIEISAFTPDEEFQ